MGIRVDRLPGGARLQFVALRLVDRTVPHGRRTRPTPACRHPGGRCGRLQPAYAGGRNRDAGCAEGPAPGVFRPLVAKHHGRIVKLTGDGVLVEFASAVNAVDALSSCNASHGRTPTRTCRRTRQIVLRIGVNLGDVLVEGGDLYGDGVNVAARLEALAEPGSVYVSQTVFSHVRGKAGSVSTIWANRR